MAAPTGAEAVVREFVERINAHDAEGVVGLSSEGHVFLDSLGSRLSGRARLEQGWRGYFALFPDYRIEIETMASDGDVVVAAGWASGTHSSTGRAWRIPAAWRARVEGGRLTEWQVYADNKPVYGILAGRG